MTNKQTIIIILSVVLGVFLLFVALFLILKYPPKFLGFKPMFSNEKITDERFVSDIPVSVSKNQLDKYQEEFLKLDVLKNEKNYLWNFKNQLLDSISKLQDKIKQQQYSGKRTLDSINKSKFLFDNLLDSINKLTVMNISAKSDVSKLQEKFKDYEKNFNKRMDSLKTQNLGAFAKIYDNSNPAEVAKILEQIDEKDAAKILKLMQKKKAGKVIEVLSPERSAAILLLGKGN